jgi:phosphoribosylaminoimidazolecarboxamide formyltransferase/IMP cyclohydrolase
MTTDYPIRRALVSVSNKSGLIAFCQQLRDLNIEIISTGGTAQLLRDNNIATTDVAEITEFPEIMGGRVKTLHPKIHGALLARLELDQAVLSQHQITPIDLLVVNLYPFSEAIAQDNCTLENAIENIDIGGPAMLRAAAKNYQRVTVIADYQDYERIAQELRSNNSKTSASTRFRLAQKAFAHTAQYDSVIAHYLGNQLTKEQPSTFPATYTMQLHKKQDLRYGENPHQRAAFYLENIAAKNCIANAEQIQGKELSFNNIADADAALECVRTFTKQAACVIVKHANPCGVACADDQLSAYQRAYATDTTSAFGGIIAFNRALDGVTAQKILDNQFVEVVIAPEISTEARHIFAQKPNIRVLACGDLQPNNPSTLDYKRVAGGMLIQDTDSVELIPAALRIVSARQPTAQQLLDLQFAWRVAQFVKSNAIVFAHNQATIGIGAGQMSRVDSTKIASRKATEANFEISGSVMASDAFFPFRDAIDAAAAAGISAIIQPGGSIRDDEVIAAADAADIAMVFTGIRHFRH